MSADGFPRPWRTKVANECSSIVQNKRVHIFGGAGSGKTTLAREYARKTKAPHHELDQFYYTDAASRQRRHKDQRDSLLNDAIATKTWVIEGIFWQPWIRPSIARSDKIVVLAIPESTRHYRVVKRHFQYLARATPNEYRYFFPTLFELLKNNRQYSAGPLRETLNIAAEYSTKMVVCTSNEDAAEVLGL